MRIVICIALLTFYSRVNAQELFVFTEPASNMPAKSIGLRVNNWFMFEQPGSVLNYHLIPEFMWGISTKWMLHAEVFFSNRNRSFEAEGGSLYLKYRFFSRDDMFSHFRMAAYGRVSSNNGTIHQEEIEINGHNTGYEGGLIFTQLLHKTALSITTSYEQVFDNLGNNNFPSTFSDQCINYTFSAGRLMWPPTYDNFKQVNINLMCEFMGQTQMDNGKGFIDVAPSVQFIVNSQARIDIGYKQQLNSSLLRTAPNGIVFKLEYLLFNAFN